MRVTVGRRPGQLVGAGHADRYGSLPPVPGDSTTRSTRVAHTWGAGALFILCAAAFYWDTTLVSVMTDRLHGNDFGKFYYSTRAFLDGGDMYAPSLATDLKLDKAPELQFLDMNPPHFHLIVLPLARLELRQAVGVWMGASVFALILSMLLIFREIRLDWTPTRLLTIAFGTLGFAGTQAFFLTGQLSMLLLLAMTVCWLDARRDRWSSVGVWLGVCLSIKPFLLILIPYLLGTRRFRAVAFTLATALACFLAGLLIFGAEAHISWYRAISQSGDWAWTPMNASALGFFRRAFGETPYFAPLVSAPGVVPLWMVAAGLVGAFSLAVAILDRTPLAVDRAFALLLVAAVLISPLGWIYYLWLPAGPIAALVWRPKDGPDRGPRSDRILAVPVIVGLMWPLVFLYVFQPRPWATLLVGSIYFLSTACLWLWLLLDGVRSRRA